MNNKTIHIKVRRIDSNELDRDVTLELDPDLSYVDLKQKFLNILEITDTDNKVFKIRNSDGFLVPLTYVLEDTSEKLFLIDITNVHHDIPAVECDSPLHSVYEDAIQNQVKNMNSRITHIESFIPHLKSRREALIERTTLTLESRLSFLSRRIDELTPAQWNEYSSNAIELRDKLAATMPLSE